MDPKDVIEAADKMEKAFGKLLHDLATDGTAIDGFTDAWNARMAYLEAKFHFDFGNMVGRLCLEIDSAPTNSEGDE